MTDFFFVIIIFKKNYFISEKYSKNWLNKKNTENVGNEIRDYAHGFKNIDRRSFFLY